MQKALSFQENKQSDYTSNEENKIQLERIDYIETSEPINVLLERGRIYNLTGNTIHCKKLLQALDLRTENTFGLKCNGHDLKHVSVHSFKSKLAWCDHLPVLLEDTFFANIKWNTNASNEEIVAAAEMVGLDQFYSNAPKGIYSKTQHRDPIWTLENRALLELARAIVTKPDLLVLRNQYILQNPKGLEIIHSQFKSSIVIIHNITELPTAGAQNIQIN
jgi:subfamily B ATP-binding cassette protein MsbA